MKSCDPLWKQQFCVTGAQGRLEEGTGMEWNQFMKCLVHLHSLGLALKKVGIRRISKPKKAEGYLYYTPIFLMVVWRQGDGYRGVCNGEREEAVWRQRRGPCNEVGVCEKIGNMEASHQSLVYVMDGKCSRTIALETEKPGEGSDLG